MTTNRAVPTRSSVFLLLAVPMFLSIVPIASARELDFEKRVTAQRAIEQVYWSHQIWPKENPAQKPALSAVMSDEAIRAKVGDYLKKSNALATTWKRPVTAEQLQAEMDRMAKSTRDAETLQELYRALGNDPFVIAETLARQTLVDRLIRNWYATDERFHGAVKGDAERVLAGMRTVAEMKALGGEYVERTLARRGDDEGTPGEKYEDVVKMDAGEWTDWKDDLARRFGTAPEELPVQRSSALQEDSDRFFITALLSFEADKAVVATVVWPKRSFDAWWSAERVETSAEVVTEFGAYAVATPRARGCVDDTWESRFYVPAGRFGQTAVWTGTEMIVWGGVGGGSAGLRGTGGRYNPTTDSWTATSTGANVPAARYLHTAVWTGTEMIVWGGGSTFNTGGRYNPTTDSWIATSTGANVPAARSNHTAVWTGTKMIVWGGDVYDGGSGVDSYLDTGGCYDPSTDSWTATSTGANVPAARTFHTAVWTGAEMIVWGGRNEDSAVLDLNSGGRYNPSTDSWTTTSTGANVPAARYGPTAVWTGMEMIVWGGNSYTGGRYNPSTDTWTATSTGANLPVYRFLHTAVWTGTEMIVWGGNTSSGGSPADLNVGGRYDPSTDSWTATSTGVNVPSGRSQHTAVWTGAEMIVWGGGRHQYGTSFNTGGRYNPTTDSWTASSTGANVPAAGAAVTAVWTGTEMIVWGGRGGRYNPVTDSWTATSTGANVPVYRALHTAVWTGTEVIVWGGVNAGFPGLNSGGRYNPMMDSWTTTSTGANVPSARAEHTAVWTGTEMIVWGGRDPNQLNTGGRYNPTTDGWTATSTGANVPVRRVAHTAVWTGKEMIVWGGGASSQGYGLLQNTGGRYSPTTDSWTATSTGANVPAARSFLTSVWTGTEMIVWGGLTESDLSNTGGRYNPTTDSWTPTSTGADVPLARYEQTAAWTGTEMIVWGGEYSSPLNTGGRYTPTTDSWTATSTGANVPEARYAHTAVWTGAQMIVWGGSVPDSNLYLYCATGCALPHHRPKRPRRGWLPQPGPICR